MAQKIKQKQEARQEQPQQQHERNLVDQSIEPRMWHLPRGRHNWMVVFLYRLVHVWRPHLLHLGADQTQGYLLVDERSEGREPCTNVSALVRQCTKRFFRYRPERNRWPWIVSAEHARHLVQYFFYASRYAATLRAYQFYWLWNAASIVTWFAHSISFCERLISDIEGAMDPGGDPAPLSEAKKQSILTHIRDIPRRGR